MESKRNDVARALNELCTSNLRDRDQAELETFIEDFFFGDSCDEDPAPPSDDEYDDEECDGRYERMLSSYPEILEVVGTGFTGEDEENPESAQATGQIMANYSQSSMTVSSGKISKEREKNRMTYYHRGIKVCRKTFLFLHAIGKRRFDAVRFSYEHEGLTIRTHGNYNRIPSNAFTTPQLVEIISFIKNYAEAHGILLPGRIPGYKRMDLQLLPTSMTKRSIWRDYINANSDTNIRTAGYHSFCRFWKKFVPHIVICKPKSDLCWNCQRNSQAISNTGNASETMKQQILQQAIVHVERARTERVLQDSMQRE